MNEILDVKLEIVHNPKCEDAEFIYPESFYVSQIVHVNGILFNGYLDINTLFEDESETWENGLWVESYLDSCSCGVPGCNGFWNGVKINKKKNTYQYSTKKKYGYPNGILGTGKWSIYISKQNIEEIRKYVLQFIKHNAKLLSNSHNELTYLLKRYNL